MSYRGRRGANADYPYGDVDSARQYPVTNRQIPAPPAVYYVPVPYYPVVDPYKAAKDAEDASNIAKLIWAMIAAIGIGAIIVLFVTL
jgi:hypothetical protein